jgi:prefoldin subunit 5
VVWDERRRPTTIDDSKTKATTMAPPNSSSASSSLWSPDHLRKLQARGDVSNDDDAGDLPELTKRDMLTKQKQYLHQQHKEIHHPPNKGAVGKGASSAPLPPPPPVHRDVAHQYSGCIFGPTSPVGSDAGASAATARTQRTTPPSSPQLFASPTSPTAEDAAAGGIPWTRSTSSTTTTTTYGSSSIQQPKPFTTRITSTSATGAAGSTRSPPRRGGGGGAIGIGGGSSHGGGNATNMGTSRAKSDYADDKDYAHRPRAMMTQQPRKSMATAEVGDHGRGTATARTADNGSTNNNDNNNATTSPPLSSASPSASFDLNRILCFPSSFFQFAAATPNCDDFLGGSSSNAQNNSNSILTEDNSHNKRETNVRSNAGTPPLPPSSSASASFTKERPVEAKEQLPPSQPPRASPTNTKPPPSPLRRLFHAAVSAGTPPRFSGNRPRASSYDGGTSTSTTPAPAVTAPFSKQQLVILDDLKHLLAGRSSNDAFEFLQHMVVDLMREVDHTNETLEEMDETWHKREQYWVQQRSDMVDCVVSALENHVDMDDKSSGDVKARKRLLHQLTSSSTTSSAPAKISMSAKPIVEATNMILDNLTSQVARLQKENEELHATVKRQQSSLDDLNGLAETRMFKIEALEQQFVALNATRGSLAKKLVDRTNQMIKLQFGGVPRVVNVHTSTNDDNVEVHQVEPPATTTTSSSNAAAIPALVEDDDDDVEHATGAYGVQEDDTMEDEDDDDDSVNHQLHNSSKQAASSKMAATSSMASSSSCCPEGSALSVD